MTANAKEGHRESRSRVVTVPPVGEPGTGLRAGLVAASVAILVALQLPAASGAGAPSLRERAQQLRSENATLEGEAGAAWLSSVSLSTRLEQTRAALVRFRARTQEISAQRAEAQQTLRLARRTLKASQGALAERLRAMYEQDETDPMAVLMGATSVDDAITRIEGLHRMARQDHAVIAEAKAAKKRLVAATQRLASQEAQARETEAATAATVAALDATRREQQAQYASLQARAEVELGAHLVARVAGARAGRCPGTVPARPHPDRPRHRLLALRPHGDRSPGRLRNRRRRPERDPARHSPDRPRLRRRRRGRHRWRGRGSAHRPLVPDPGRSPRLGNSDGERHASLALWL